MKTAHCAPVVRLLRVGYFWVAYTENYDVWDVENPHNILHLVVFRKGLHVNVWAGIIGGQLIVPNLLPCLTAAVYVTFL